MPPTIKKNRASILGPDCLMFVQFKDLVGWADEGMVVSAVAPTVIDTPWGKGMTFNGATNYIDADYRYFMPDAFALEVLIKSNAGAGGRALIGWGVNFSQVPSIWWNDGTGLSLIYMTGNNYREFNANPVNIYDGSWHHVVYNLPGSGINDILTSAVYADGQSQTVGVTSNAGAQTAKSNFRIMGSRQPLYCSADIVYMAMYRRSLTAAEITDRYNTVRANKLY